MYCLFSLQENENLKFIFASVYLESGEHNEDLRIKCTQTIRDRLSLSYRDLPIFVSGNFNSTPKSKAI